MGIPRVGDSGTARLRSVSAEPPMPARSTCMTRCSLAPSATATRRAASSSAAWRWPYSTDSAWQAKPCARASASAVAESRPPESSTMAGARSTSLPRHVAPQELVQLHLQAHRQLVFEDPVGELARGQLLVARREEHGAAPGELQLRQARAAPLVVVASANDELDEVLGSQALKFRVA